MYHHHLHHLPTSLGGEFRDALDSNFTKIEDALNNFQSDSNMKEIEQKITENNEEMYKAFLHHTQCTIIIYTNEKRCPIW